MKPIQEFTRCEFCDKQISMQSPPHRNSYENAEIHLQGSSTILLPAKIAKDSSHARDIDGRYCSPKCLINMLKKILGVESKKHFK